MVQKFMSLNPGRASLGLENSLCQPSSNWFFSNHKRIRLQKERNGLSFSYAVPKIQWAYTPTATLATILQIFTFYHFDQWQLVARLTEEPGVPYSLPSPATYFRFSFKNGIFQLLEKVCPHSTD